MRDPASEKQGWVAHVTGIEAVGAEEVARVIERHQRHNETA
jgi:hypothetical protein